MKRIELTEAQIQVIKDQLDGKIEIATATPEQQKELSAVIDMAEELINEMDAYDELDTYDDDLINWFYAKYQQQPAI